MLQHVKPHKERRRKSKSERCKLHTMTLVGLCDTVPAFTSYDLVLVGVRDNELAILPLACAQKREDLKTQGYSLISIADIMESTSRDLPGVPDDEIFITLYAQDKGFLLSISSTQADGEFFLTEPSINTKTT